MLVCEWPGCHTEAIWTMTIPPVWNLPDNFAPTNVSNWIDMSTRRLLCEEHKYRAAHRFMVFHKKYTTWHIRNAEVVLSMELDSDETTFDWNGDPIGNRVGGLRDEAAQVLRIMK
jgi:hypothetical protein